MRLLCLSPYPPDLGGIPNHVQGLLRGLAEYGWESEVLRPTAVLGRGIESASDGPALRVHSVAARYAGEQFDVAYALQNLQVVEAAAAVIAGGRTADLLVCQGSQFALAALALADVLGCPLVYHAHGVYSSPGPAETGFRPGLMLAIERDIAGRADHVIAISDYIAELCAELGTPAARLSTIPKGLHMAEFAGAWRPPPSPLALFVGRLSPIKGLETLFAAIAELAGAGRPISAAVVGSGERQYVEKIRRLIDELGIGARVWFVGQLPADQLVGLYQRASVTVVPSDMEALGRVAIEAMASGCPLVVTDVGGLGPLVTDGVTGWKVPAGRPGELAEAMWAAISDPVAAGTRAAAARVVVARDFAYASVIDRTRATYQRVTGS